MKEGVIFLLVFGLVGGVVGQGCCPHEAAEDPSGMEEAIVLPEGFVPVPREGPLQAWCSIPPLVSVVQAVGGERVTVRSLQSGAQDPHTWSPSPALVAEARQADLFFMVGIGAEPVVARRLQSMNPALATVNLAAGLGHPGDPHVWLSLPLLNEVATRVAAVLGRLDPAGATGYQDRLKRYQAELAERHAALKVLLEPQRGTVFFVYHPAFGYFAEDYGLRQEVVELDGKTPSPKHLLALIRRAQEERVRTVFVQPQFSQRSARMVADRIDGRVVELDQLAENPVETVERAVRILVQMAGEGGLVE